PARAIRDVTDRPHVLGGTSAPAARFGGVELPPLVAQETRDVLQALRVLQPEALTVVDDPPDVTVAPEDVSGLPAHLPRLKDRTRRRPGEHEDRHRAMPASPPRSGPPSASARSARAGSPRLRTARDTRLPCARCRRGAPASPDREASPRRARSPPGLRSPRRRRARRLSPATAGLQDGGRARVVPVVDDVREDVGVRRANLSKGVAADERRAVGNPEPREGGPRALHHVRLVEEDAAELRVRGEDRPEQHAVPPADVDEGPGRG